MANKSEGVPEKRPDRETRILLQRVYKRLMKEKDETIPQQCTMQKRLAALTGLNPEKLNDMKKGKKVVGFPCTIHRSFIHAEFLNCLKWCVPCTTQLYHACQSSISPHVDIGDFRKILFKMDYVWKIIPNRPCVVLERPEVVYRRFSFLKTILAKSGISESFDDMYFIEECAIDENLNMYDYNDKEFENNDPSYVRLIYAVSIDTIVFNFLSEHSAVSFKHWIATELLPGLQKPSTIVYTNAEHHCEADPCVDLNLESLRCEMTAWLDKNNVPYESTMSKYELFTLIEKCTNKHANRYVVDNLIKAYDHTPLRLPDDINRLSPAAYVYVSLKKHFRQHLGLNFDEEEGTVQSKISFHVDKFISTENSKYYFEEAFKLYKKAYEEEVHVDAILDNLIQVVRAQNDDGDSDLPSLSDDSD